MGFIRNPCGREGWGLASAFESQQLGSDIFPSQLLLLSQLVKSKRRQTAGGRDYSHCAATNVADASCRFKVISPSNTYTYQHQSMWLELTNISNDTHSSHPRTPFVWVIDVIEAMRTRTNHDEPRVATKCPFQIPRISGGHGDQGWKNSKG